MIGERQDDVTPARISSTRKAGAKRRVGTKRMQTGLSLGRANIENVCKVSWKYVNDDHCCKVLGHRSLQPVSRLRFKQRPSSCPYI
jgi:hypothetical protein